MPFLQRFFGSDLVTKISLEMLDTLSENYEGHLRSASTQPQYLRYCPCCVEEDRLNHGEAYWRRLHQLAVVHVCPEHGVFLNRSSVQRAVMTPYFLITAEQAVGRSASVKMLDQRAPYATLLIWLAVQSQWLLNQPTGPGNEKKSASGTATTSPWPDLEVNRAK